jgi:general secretion pathway protein G
MHRHPPQQGFSRFEVLVVVALLGILSAVLLERMRYLQEYAEMTAVEVTVANLRTGLRYRVGDLLIRDKLSEISTLADENPINWLETRPPNYLGEYDAEPDSDVKGRWYFDRSHHELVYTANNRRFFTPASYRDYTVRLRAVRLQQGASGSKQAVNAAATPQWVSLVQVTDGKWF